MSCPDENTLSGYASGGLDAEGTEAVRQHVSGCSECRSVLAVLGGFLAPSPSVDAGLLVTGARVGRYIVLGLLGEGGMGRVHAAYDPELDRKVALKLLNLARLGEGSLTQARQRLEREARTMARLSHPHVAHLHDVGEFQGQLFLVMELVEGGTLRRWLAEKPRTRREILARFIQAADGLAATHALGISHRDFKPDNVLLTRDGQVRITDFGLANAAGLEPSRGEVRSTDVGLANAATGVPSRGPVRSTDVGLANAATGVPSRGPVRSTDVGLANAVVLESSRGEVRSTDVGLANAAGLEPSRGEVRSTDVGPASATGEPPREAEPLVPVAEPLTATGVFLGTPAYAAPEQLRGARGDARSDQFAFCVALYEALNGQRPFAGATGEELLASMLRQEVRPEKRGIPSWLKAVVRRGLHADPSRRFESMQVLRSRLSREASAWKRSAAVAVLAGGLVGLGFLVLGPSSTTPSEACHGSERHLAGIWDTSVRESTHLAFLRTEDPLAEASFQAVASSLEQWTRDWTHAHRSACEATRVFGEQSEAALGLRMTCLDQRLGELSRLTVALQGADARTVERGFKLGASLGGVGRCADVRTLQEAVSPPQDPTVRAEVEAVRVELARANAELLAGHTSEALRISLPARERALATRHRPLEAEAHQLHALLQEDAGAFEDARASLAQGSLAAEAGRHLGVLARVLKSQAWLHGYGLGRTPEAWPFLQRARAVAETLRDAELDTMLDHVQAELLEQEGRFSEAEPLLRASLETATTRGQTHARAELSGRLGLLARQQGRLLEAKRWQEEALRLHEEHFGPAHRDTGRALANLGGTLALLGELSRAEAVLQRALTILRKTLGEENLSVARTLSNLALVYFEWGHGAQAREAAEASWAVARKSVAADSPVLMGMASNRLGVLGEQGERPLELEHVRRVLAHRERVYGASHPEVALDVHEVGRLLRLLGRPDEARAFHARGVALQEPLVARGEVDGAGLRSLADALLFLGKVDEARRHVDQSLASMERDLGPASSERIEALLLLGDVQLARGQPAEALAPLRTALEVLTARQVSSARVPRVRRRLARALRLTGATQEACAEAHRAWEELTPWSKAYAQETAEARAELGHCRSVVR
ncbi:protein kinase domain-containing protein [Myxococcus qinghaiensis]|uniref:protein kinase domain-containing protein n=1 Tax=Myxococcus qinghaiensis TaxID=2906758 RepID=UPI0020A8273C|nr:tetratricopeptide repeat protein [Myxococcus qinghaiensis]MCP3168018.1 serine/threonine-protein kinase [Myxococcus qinghaiensis]